MEVVGPGRSWPPLENERYVAPSLQCARDMLVRVQAATVLQEEPRIGRSSGAPWMQKQLRQNGGITSLDGEDIWQDLQEAYTTGDRETNSPLGYEKWVDVLEGPATAQA
jgi:hypothetical protein